VRNRNLISFFLKQYLEVLKENNCDFSQKVKNLLLAFFKNLVSSFMILQPQIKNFCIKKESKIKDPLSQLHKSLSNFL